MDETRRGFLKFAVVAVNALIAGLLGVPVVGNLLAPIFRGRSVQWVEAGPADSFAGEVPRAARLVYRSTAGAREVEKRATVWVLSREGSTVAFSSDCTHAACVVGWDKERSLFLCPCHGGEFDIDGRVVAGPPPEPLKRLPTKVEGGKLFVEV